MSHKEQATWGQHLEWQEIPHQVRETSVKPSETIL